MKQSHLLRFLSLAVLLLLALVSAGFELAFSVHSQVKLDEAQQALVESSKQAIVATGISESYFQKHFTLLKVFNQPSDRRVMWKFALNGYEAVLNDSIGSISDGLKRTNIHNVGRILGQTAEITKTIPRARALRAMKSCIGNYSEPYVEYGNVNGRAELFLVSTAKPIVNTRKQTESAEKEREEAEKRSRATSDIDQIENEEGEKEKSPVIIGYINLQTGKCTKGKGISAKESR